MSAIEQPASAILRRHAERRDELRARALARWTEYALMAVTVGVALMVLAGAFAYGVWLRQLMPGAVTDGDGWDTNTRGSARTRRPCAVLSCSCGETSRFAKPHCEATVAWAHSLA